MNEASQEKSFGDLRRNLGIRTLVLFETLRVLLLGKTIGILRLPVHER